MIKLKNFIGGEFCEPQSGTYLDNFEPATGQVYSQLPDSNELDVVLAVQRANKAFVSWSALKAEERAGFLYRIADLIEENLEALAAAESRDVGKPLALARSLDIPRAAHNFRFFAGRILHHQEASTYQEGHSLNYTLRQPVGVAGLISPWNLPLYLLTWKIAPALACGNTVVCKPSEVTPMTAFLLAELMQKADLPQGVCNIIFGRGEVAGRTLVEHPAVPLISFTGGTATGAKIAQAAAPHFKKLGLELGGKNANIVLKDANLKKAVETSLRSSFLNQGQICLCGSRIYVQQDIYDQFMESFVAGAEALVVGDPRDEKTFMGPLVSAEHLAKVKGAIDQAVSEGGKVLAGGVQPKDLPSEMAQGYFLRPTVVADLSQCSEIHQEEIFGPVVTVQPFKYAHEAVKWANTSSYGLAASLWTQNLTQAHKLAGQIQAGTVWVNTWMNRDLRMPFGGMKASGLGREGGDYSIDFYTEQKTVCVGL